MNTSPIRVVLVACVSSAATVGVIELLRAPTPASRAGVQAEQPDAPPASGASRPLEPTAGTEDAPDPSAGLESRFVDLEMRLAALELRLTRQPIEATSATEELPPREELRDLVLDWVAADPEARGLVEQLEEKDGQRAQREFEARFQAHMFAQEHGLVDWQEEKFAELFLATAERTAEIEAGIDLTVDDPKEVEARWLVFDEWVDQREREVTLEVDPELYQKIYGDDD